MFQGYNSKGEEKKQWDLIIKNVAQNMHIFKYLIFEKKYILKQCSLIFQSIEVKFNLLPSAFRQQRSLKLQ